MGRGKKRKSKRTTRGQREPLPTEFRLAPDPASLPVITRDERPLKKTFHATECTRIVRKSNAGKLG